MDDAKLKLNCPALLAVPRQHADRLLESGDGDAALLYLHILKNGGALDVSRAAAELRLSPRRIENLAMRLEGMGLLSEGDAKPLPDRALSARRRTLRVRLENGAAVAAFKTPDLGHGRGEWEVPGADPRAALAAAGETVEGPLVPVCGARFQRRRRRIPTGDGTAELALDAGVLTGGGREVPFQEVEVELKSGSREAAEKTARSLAARFSLTEEPRSKFRRAMDLAGG